MKIFDFDKQKAIFMIYLIVLTAVYFSIFLAIEAKPIYAARACCEKTTQGEFCKVTDSSECDPDFKKADYVACENADFCKPVCCIDKIEGRCTKNTYRSSCEANSGEIVDDTLCNTADCEEGCCEISEFFWGAKEECRKAIEDFNVDIENIFDSDVKNELECLNKGREQEQGCCIKGNEYAYKSLKDCNYINGIFEKKFCSEIKESRCIKREKKGCLPGKEDVYWFDSCGNSEDTAEDCDYASGTLCGLDNGEFKCEDINCKTTTAFSGNPNTGGLRINGESWCVYDGRVGPGMDLVGSRHYLAKCVNGKEVIEPCKDYREEICIWGKTTISGTERTEAQCVTNDYAGCTTECNTAKGENKKSAYKRDKECCLSKSRFCFWSGGVVSEQDVNTTIKQSSPKARVDGGSRGVCLPIAPPGFALGEVDDQPKADADLCDAGNTKCTVVWEKKKSFGKCEVKGCIANCQCLTDDWVTSVNDYCRALGDCGAHFNIAGIATKDGFSENAPGKLKLEKGTDWLDAGDGLFVGDFDEKDFSEYEGQSILSAITPNAGAFVASLAVNSIAANMMGVGGLKVFGVRVAAGFSKAATTKGLSTLQTTMSKGLQAAGGVVKVMGAIFAVISLVLLIVTIVNVLRTILFGDCGVKKKTYKANCGAWEAPLSGDCDFCNKREGKECTEYACMSLGKSCKFVNKGTSDEKCVAVAIEDKISPIISPWVLGKTISTNENGYEIKDSFKAYSRVNFGIKTNELARCKYSEELGLDYDEILNFINDAYKTEHNITYESLAGGKYEYYVKCVDYYGNKNMQDYKIKFEVERGPDLTPPEILSINPENGALIDASTSELNVELDINEPSECKWSSVDKDFSMMENEFFCDNETSEDGSYSCDTRIIGILSNATNKFNFRCTDVSENEMQQSYEYIIKGTEQLTILSAEPSGDIFDKSIVLAVKTSSDAICYYNDIRFFESGGMVHEQKLELESGNYAFEILCEDTARNEASKVVNIKVRVDKTAPKIVKLYKINDVLHITTDEDSVCEESNKRFNFGSGARMPIDKTREHDASSAKTVYYIICRDKFENEMQAVVY